MLIVLHGPVTFRSLRSLEEIKEKFKRDVDPTGSSIIVFDEGCEDADRLHNALFASSFFARRRLIILKNILRANVSVRAIVEKTLETSPDMGEHIVVCWEDKEIGKPAKRSGKSQNKIAAKKTKKITVTSKVLEELLLHSPYVKYFGQLTNAELVRWVSEECKRMNTEIDPSAAEEFAHRVGGDLWRADNELQKLRILARGKISKRDVAEHVLPAVEDRIFDVIDGVLRGNTRESILAAERLLEGGLAFQEFFAILVGQLRNVWEAKAGVSRADVHPFARKKALDASKRFSEIQIKNILSLLVRIDQDSKTTQQSPALLVDRLIVHLSEAIRIK